MNSPRTTAIRILPGLIIALAVAGQLIPMLSKPVPQTADSQGTIRSRVVEVLVPVTVKKAGGALADDLRQDEFRVFEDDIEQRITSFSGEGVPLSALLLLDDDMSTKSADQVQKSLVAMA